MYIQFEHLDCIINIGKVLYIQTTLSKQNGFRNSFFFDQWSKYLDNISIIPYDAIITGDLNFNVGIKSNVKGHTFFSILDSHGLTQHVKQCNPQRRQHTRFGHL